MNIDGYLAMAEERFSGFDADQLDLGADGYYEDEDFGSADGFFYADASEGASRRVPAKTPTPYQVNVTNTTAGALTVVLFGMNTFLLTPNFGSSVGVTVSPAQVNVSYLELLNQSANQPFETSLMRIQTSNPSQLTQILTVTSKDANGQLCQIPIITQSYFSANQFQSTILDVNYPVKIDGNTNVSFPILGNTTATYTFFPAEKVNPSRVLGGGSVLQQYGSTGVAAAVPMFAVKPVGLNKPRVMIPSKRR